MRLWLGLVLAAAITCAQDWQPFRIVAHFDHHILALEQDMQDNLNNATKTAFDLLGRALRVRRAPGKLLLPRECMVSNNYANTRDFLVCNGQCHSDNKCDTIDIPHQHLMPCVTCPNAQSIHGDGKGCVVDGKAATKDSVAAAKSGGVDADFIMYFTVKQGTCEEKASAKVCRQAFDSRPIAARTAFCNPTRSLRKNVIKTVLRETIHALAMSDALFRFFSKEDGTPYTKRDEKNNWISNPETVLTSPTKQITRNWMSRHGMFAHNVTIVTTPKVVAEARAHFACPTMEGVELENEGGKGTAGTHWESRHLHQDIIALFGDTLSRITLALLEDSGWYKADYTQATELTWGRGLGCDFVEKSCGEWITKKRDKGLLPHPYCDQMVQHGCSFDRMNHGQCTATLYMDNCDYMWKTEKNKCTSLTKPGQGPIVYAEVYGVDSRCISFHGQWMRNGQKYLFGDYRPHYGGCYRTDCSGGQLRIEFEGQWHTCTEEGMKIPVQTVHNGTSVTGTLLCPGIVEICPSLPSATAAGNRMWIAALLILKFLGILF